MIFFRFLRQRQLSIINSAIIAFLVINLLTASTSSATESAFSPDQKDQLNRLIRQYIYDHPEVIIDAIQRLQSRQKAEEQTRVISAIKENKENLESDPEAPVIGNPNANITVVEFFDYRCGYCKRVFTNMVSILRENPNVRFVLKEFPILGAESLVASRASLAVWRTHKDKYQAFHAALLEARGGMPKAKILSIAEKLGINKNQLKKDMNDPAIDRILNKNRHLGQALNINGTPAFIFGDKLIPGALDLDTMRQMIKASGG